MNGGALTLAFGVQVSLSRGERETMRRTNT